MKRRINDYTIEYEFFATKSQIDISGYSFKMTSRNKDVEIKVLYNGEISREYFSRKTLLDGKMFIEVVMGMPTRCKREFKIIIVKKDGKKINVKRVFRRISMEYNRYMIVSNC